MSLVSVVGATGRQGLAQVRQLLDAGHSVRALSRSAEPNLGKTNHPIEVRHFDLYDPSTHVPAFEGSDAVFYTHPLQARITRPDALGAVGAAAKEAGAQRFIWNVSSWIPDKPGEPDTYADNTAGINALWATGIPATVFGSVLFMDNLLTDWARPFMMRDKRYIYPHAPSMDCNWISLDDVGKIMVAALDRPDLIGAWMNIGGPEKLKGPQVCQILSDVLGFELSYDPCTPAEFGDNLVAALGDTLEEELRQPFAQRIADFYTYNNTAPTRPFSVNTEAMMERLPEIQLETMRAWAARQDWSDYADRPSAG